MTETNSAEKKKTNPLIFVGVGCFVLIVLLSAVTTVFFKFFAKKAIEGVIENKTGLNVSDAEKGKVTFTDEKTGAKVDIGSGKIPEAFPKDFPLYPGVKVGSAMSGAEAGKNNGFWLTMSTSDSVDAIGAFYAKEFSANGWTAETTAMFTPDTISETVQKGQWSGTLTITKDTNSKETQIVIILGQNTSAGE